MKELGGENYNTMAYVTESPYEKGVIWTGSDCGYGLSHKRWMETLEKCNACRFAGMPGKSIEVSPYDKATAYIAATRYKFNDYASVCI